MLETNWGGGGGLIFHVHSFSSEIIVFTELNSIVLCFPLLGSK